MVNDDHGLLIGLYRECSSCKTLEENAKFVRKEIVFEDAKYEILEKTVDRNKIWRVYSNSVELSREEILYLYASANLRRQMKAHF
jgi:hypothetical protein